MLDIKFVRENPDAVKENIKKKFQDEKLPLVDEAIELDAKKRANQQEADDFLTYFKMLKQKTDDNGSPVFSFQVLLEGVEGEKGSGYSKKEAQQLASKETLQRLKREPQFIDMIFSAKTERTKMEEEPAMAVPDTEQEQEFIISEVRGEKSEVREMTKGGEDKSLTSHPSPLTSEEDFDLSDLSVKPKEKTREDIIAEAEAAAFAEA